MPKPCGNPKCCSSTGICERITHGHGLLSENGYWQHPCFTCARHFEGVFKEAQWPHPTEDSNPLADLLEKRKCEDCGKESDFFKKYVGNQCDECYLKDENDDEEDRQMMVGILNNLKSN